MTDLQQNKDLCTRWIELIGDGDVEGMSALITAGWRMYGGPPERPAGPEGLRALFAAIGPIDQKWTIDDVIARATGWSCAPPVPATRTRSFGVPAHGTRQVFTATFTFQVEGDRIVEVWRNADDLGRLFQLGARIVAP